MGIVLGTMMGSVTCGVATTTLNCIFCSCPWGSSTVSKYIYTGLLLMTLTFSYLWNSYIRTPFNYPSFPDGSSEQIARYYGPWAIATGMVLFHGLLGILLFGMTRSDDPRAIVQNGWWPVKALLLITAVISGFLMPVSVYKCMYYTAVIGTIAYLALQSVFLVDFAYRGAELLVEKYEESEGPLWKYVLFGVTGFLYLISLAFNGIVGYKFFDSGLLPFAIINSLLIVIVTVCSVLEVVQEANPQAGIFQAAFVSFYNTYLLVASTAESAKSADIPGWQGSIYFISVLLFVVGMFYYAASIGEERSGDSEDVEDVEKGSKSSLPPDTEYSVFLFHIFFIMAFLYGTMMILKWNWGEIIDGQINLKTSANLAFWSRIVSSWSLTGFYLWSLFAPLVFTDREFA